MRPQAALADARRIAAARSPAGWECGIQGIPQGCASDIDETGCSLAQANTRNDGAPRDASCGEAASPRRGEGKNSAESASARHGPGRLDAEPARVVAWRREVPDRATLARAYRAYNGGASL